MTDYDESTSQAKLMFSKICESVRNNSRLTQADKDLFEIVAEDFARSFEQILNINDERTRLAAEHAVSLALGAGYFFQGNLAIIEKMKAEVRYNQTKSARSKHARPEIRAIVEELALDLWADKHKLRYSPTKTARTIWLDVITRVNSLAYVRGLDK
jgi:hypothetical protein